MTSWSGSARAQTTCQGDDRCVSPIIIRQCAEDARAIDDTRARLRSCQRDLDAATGSAQGSTQQLLALLELERKRHAALTEEVGELRRRPRWLQVAVVVAGVGVTAYLGGRLHQHLRGAR